MAVPAKKRSPAAPPARPNLVAAARGKAPPRHGGWRENVRSILGALLIFLVVRTFLVEAFRIPSGSMIPTLLVGDWLFVNKLVYGPHIPFTDVNLPGYGDPERKDVVVFESPYQPDEAMRGADPTPTLVKRLWGTPGDTLYMRDGLLYVNGVPQPQPAAMAQNPVGDPGYVAPHFAWQAQYALHDTRFGSAPAQPTLGNWGPILIPADHYFMLGDNRYESKDSRYWGLVPRANLRGRPMFVYYSWEAERHRPFGFLRDIRWDRIGHRIR
ncbi:MAG TPA: signal peptidase I [Gemmatimonadaceae bacterium]|nr:signal peptidase I [Gemmatimonadaceae bacterium]